ncbi:hypothetical protein Tco_0195261 [Tanacetum coccineum]
MFTDEYALDYSSPPLWDDYDDELFDLETVNDDTYDDPFDSKEEKIKDSKILIDELDPPGSSDFLPFPECDSIFYEDFSEVDTLSSTNNEDKVFNSGILIHENLYEVTNCATPEKNVKKTTNASLILEDFNPPLYELPFHKEVPGLGALLSFSSENEEKVFNPGILISKRVYTSLLQELSHRGPKAFKVIKIFESPMEIFPCFYGEDIRVLDVPCTYTPTNVLIAAVEAAENILPVAAHEEAETIHNMTTENKLYFQAEKEAIFLILTGIGDEIYSTVDACNTSKEMWTAIERLQQGESLNVQDVKTNLFWEFGRLLLREGDPWSLITPGFIN